MALAYLPLPKTPVPAQSLPAADRVLQSRVKKGAEITLFGSPPPARHTTLTFQRHFSNVLAAHFYNRHAGGRQVFREVACVLSSPFSPISHYGACPPSSPASEQAPISGYSLSRPPASRHSLPGSPASERSSPRISQSRLSFLQSNRPSFRYQHHHHFEAI